MPTGTFNQKILRHPIHVVSTPPSTGPAQRSRGSPDFGGGCPIRDRIYYAKEYSPITRTGGICTHIGQHDPGYSAEKQWKQARRKRPARLQARREEDWTLALNCARAFSR